MSVIANELMGLADMERGRMEAETAENETLRTAHRVSVEAETRAASDAAMRYREQSAAATRRYGNSFRDYSSLVLRAAREQHIMPDIYTTIGAWRVPRYAYLLEGTTDSKFFDPAESYDSLNGGSRPGPASWTRTYEYSLLRSDGRIFSGSIKLGSIGVVQAVQCRFIGNGDRIRNPGAPRELEMNSQSAVERGKLLLAKMMVARGIDLSRV